MRTLTACALAGTLLSSLFLTTFAHADNGPYLGASLGNAQVGYKDPNDTLNLDIRDSDTGYKIFAGFKFTLVAVEAGYVDFGQIDGNSGSIEVSGFNAFGKLSMGLGPVEIFGKAGGFAWESNYKAAVNAFNKNSDKGFDPAIGFGAAFDLGGVGVRAEYEYYDIKEFDKVSMISLGAVWWLF